MVANYYVFLNINRVELFVAVIACVRAGGLLAPLPVMAAAAEGKQETWDAATVASHATMLSSAKTADTPTSSLPSVVAAAVMEAEGEEEVNRLVGSLREEKKVRFLFRFSTF